MSDGIGPGKREGRFWIVIGLLVVAGVLFVLGGGRWLWHQLLVMHGRH